MHKTPITRKPRRTKAAGRAAQNVGPDFISTDPIHIEKMTQGRPRLEPDLRHYSGIVANRLYILRRQAGLTVEQLIEKISEIAVKQTCKKCGQVIWTLRVANQHAMRCANGNCTGSCTVSDLVLGRRTLFAWEKGRHNDGNDVPLDMVPIFAAIYGYADPGGWMP